MTTKEGILILLLSCIVLQCTCIRNNKRIADEVLKLSNSCQELYVDVDDYDEVLVKSQELRPTRHPVSKDSSCVAYFKTSQPSQGLCVDMQGLHISSPHVSLEIQTGPYSPERILGKHSPWNSKWCFPHSVVAIRVMTKAYEEDFDSAAVYKFAVTNVSLDSIPRTYYMDSFVECELTHQVTAGKDIHIEAEREPRVTLYPPDTCQLTFESTSAEEYEQVCLEMQVIPPTGMAMDDPIVAAVKRRILAEKAVQIQGLNTRFYSIDKALNGEVTCSVDKRLTLLLSRNQSRPFNFQATVTSKWHPHWETEDTEASELRGLRVVKGITYFIATIDSLVAVLAAALAAILKRPTGPWRRWAENFNAHSTTHASQAYPPQDPSNYGSMHTCKDDNYPELPLEGPTATNEVLVESHTY